MTSASCHFGLDVGGTRLKALAVDAAGKVLARETGVSEGPDWQQAIKRCVEKLSATVGPPASIGVVAPGLSDRDERAIEFMPGRLPGLVGLNWAEFLGFPENVPVLNDAHGALLGEVWQGAARGERDVVLVTLGTGVGGAILCHGQLMRGHVGRAGHLGHLSIDADGALDLVQTPGSLEDAIGNHSLSARSGGRYVDTRDLVADVTRGDAFAAEIWSRSVRRLAVALTGIINVVDPAVIIIGGGIAEAGDALFVPLARELDRVEWRPGGHKVRVIKAQLGDWAGAFGAAWRALHYESVL